MAEYAIMCPFKMAAMRGYPKCERSECALFINGKCAIRVLAESNLPDLKREDRK